MAALLAVDADEDADDDEDEEKDEEKDESEKRRRLLNNNMVKVISYYIMLCKSLMEHWWC